MPASQLVSAQHGIIAWSKNADGDTAQLVVQAAILVRRSMEPTGRGAASNIGQPTLTVGVQATTTPSKAVSSIALKLQHRVCGAFPPKGSPFYWRTRIVLPSTITSILVRKKQSSASAGLHTMGSFSLKEVLRTIGTPVSSRNASISA